MSDRLSVRLSMKEELETIAKYTRRAKASSDPLVRRVYGEIIPDEREHFKKLAKLLGKIK